MRIPTRLFYILFFVGLFMISASRTVNAKSYSILSDTITYTLRQDKSADVQEYLTYAFDGSFSWAEMWIPVRITRQGNNYTSSVTGFSVSVADKTPVTLLEAAEKDNKFYAKWGYTALDEQKTFVIRYRLENAVRKYQEISEFYWQAVGPDWDIPHQNVTVTVMLPAHAGSLSQILVYGHGSLNGRAEILDTNKAQFSAAEVATGQFMEVRVAFPSAQIQGQLDGELTQEQLKRQEQAYVEETIAAAKRTQKLKFVTGMWLIGAPVIMLLVVGAWILWWYHAWKKVGKEYQVFKSRVVREPPSALTPAEVDVLLTQEKEPSIRAFTATIFDLARKGLLTIEDRVIQQTGLLRTKQVYQTNIKLTGEIKDIKQLKLSEKLVLELLFNEISTTSQLGNEMLLLLNQTLHTDLNLKQSDKSRDAIKGMISFDEIKKWLKEHPTSFQTWFKKWKETVLGGVKTHDFVEDASERAFRNSWFITIILTVIGIFIFNVFTFVILGMGWIMNPYLKRWNRKWADEVYLWKSFKAFLDEFAGHKFKEIPPEAYKLWELYLVFGILFGNAKKIISMLPVVLENPQAAHASWYVSNIGTGQSLAITQSLSGFVSNLNVVTADLLTASTSAAHYSSGSGGGFSGGGGGGGGGGGAG